MPPALIAGKYRLTRLLGRGGMGSVWEGVHETLGTRVAVKLIEVENVQSADSRRRFETEARAAAKLQSKHVVEVYDYGVSPEGHPFIVMQYLSGEPLDRRLEREGRLSPVDTARIVIQVCRALSRAHSLGIIHRDLKPENVFLMRDEEDGTELVKVVDFGIAKVVGGSVVGAPEDSATRTGSVLGTPYYMSPEQARGLRSVDHRSDLWSVGVIAFRCMVGRLPFQGEAVGDVLVNLCTGPIPVPSELVSNVPPGFDRWIERALSRSPSERFSTAAELGEALAVTCGLTTPMAPFGGDARHSDPQIHQLGRHITAPAPPDGPSVRPPLSAVTKSGSVSITFRSPSGHTGSPTANTPAPTPRQNTSTIIMATVLATLTIAVSIVALTRLRGGSGDEPAAASAPPAPSAAPALAATLQRPSEAARGPAQASENALPPTPSATASAEKTPPASGSVATSTKATKGSGPSRTAAAPRKKQEAASAPTQSLEIRLER